MVDIASQLLDLPKRHYRCLLGDPPWAFKTYSGNRVPQRAKQQHYQTMTEAELVALPVAQVVADNALLVMWVLDTHIDQALRIGAAWGFEFKTVGLVWHKMSEGGRAYIGLGHWFRSTGEVSLLFTHGTPKRMSRAERQFIYSPVREHSRKPEDQYRRIERLVAGPRLELFARQRRPGWDAVGNELGKFNPLNEVA